MDTLPLLLPRPRRIVRADGALPLAAIRRLVIDQRCAAAVAVGARHVAEAVRERTGLAPEVMAEARPAPAPDAVMVELAPGSIAAQGYRLSIGAGGIALRAADAAGAFHGLQTLAQLVRVTDGDLSGLAIEDWPDFPARGAMLDISRARVPTMATLRALIDRMASWKFNQLQLYTEHTFAYRDHAEVWAECSPITAAEALELDAYCRERFIELVPNQNSFGHLNRFLTLPRYRHLADNPEVGAGWGPGTLCPTDPRSADFVRGLYAELLPNFSSRMVNVGCDEVGLGGRSAAACAERGTVEVYLDFLAAIHGMAADHGRRIQFWGDIVAHHPERIGRIPKDAIGLAWGYEVDHPFAEQARGFRDAGLECYVCPGTSGWASIAGRTSVMEANQRKAAAEGRANGATGFLTTDWGNGGHQQGLPTSELALATGAAMAWCLDANPALDRAGADAHVFRDRSGVVASIVAALGEVHREIPKPVSDGSWPYYLLCLPFGERPDPAGLTRDGLRRTLARIDDAVRPLGSARCARDDAGLVVAEIAHTATQLRLACRTGLRLLGDDAPDASADALATALRLARGEHAIRWLARNRPGGLSESLHFLTNGVAATLGADKPWYWGGVRM